MAQTIVSSPFTDNRMTLTVSHTSHGFDANDIGKAVADEAREKEIFQRLIKNAGSKMAEEDVIEIFSIILKISRKIQK